jgi:hypothetical protein
MHYIIHVSENVNYSSCNQITINGFYIVRREPILTKIAKITSILNDIQY